jgi:hypothetical protein
MDFKKFMKRGQMGLGNVPQIMLSLIFIVTVGVAAYLVLAGLGDSTTNASADRAVGNFTLSLDNIISYAPTWGVLIGVGVLIAIVLGAFYFGRKAM